MVNNNVMNKTLRNFGVLTSIMLCALSAEAVEISSEVGLARPANVSSGSPASVDIQKEGMTTAQVTNRRVEVVATSEFSKYVFDTIGKNLNLYGAGFFSQVPSTFAPSQNQSVNADYIIGAGDELQIRGWGMVDIDLTVSVDRAGAIYIPRVGSVSVAGVKYKDLQGYLKKSVGRIFTNFELSVSLVQARAIQVFVTGFARQPGSYQISSLSTLVNALFAVGGASPDGTLRRIEVKRSGKTISSFDLYAFLADGSKAADIDLKDGDVIHIPAIGNMVALTGLVKQPAIYEVLPGETLAALIRKAGGVQPMAELAPLKMEVVDKGRIRTVENKQDYAGLSELLNAMANVPLQQGGIYRVFSTEAIALRASATQHYVKVDGEVKIPGTYKLSPGESLRELIARIGGVTEDAYLYGMVFSRPSIREQQQKALAEAVERFERESEAAAAEKLSSTSVSENIAAIQAELQRNRLRAKSMREIQAIGRVALEFRDYKLKLRDLPDMSLEDGDSIYIPRQPGTINVFGAVNNAAAFMYKPSRRVADYLELAGGLGRNAEAKDLYVLKADGTAYSKANTGLFSSVNGYPLAPGDSIIVPEAIERGATFTQGVKEWTSILYQFGLGAAGLKVLKD